MRNFLRGNAAQIVALAVIGALYVMARLPAITKAERSELSSSFQFSQRPLPEVPGLPQRGGVEPHRPQPVTHGHEGEV